MSATTLAAQTPIANLFADIRQGNRWLWISILGMMAILVVTLVAQQFDARLLNGVNVWDKPAKFALSIAVQLATVSWALMQLPENKRNTRAIGIAVFVMLFWSWAEQVYIMFRAAQGEASHFNSSTAFARIAYAIMGFGAVSMTASAAFVGFLAWRERKRGLLTEAAGLGLLVGMFLGTLTAFYMGGQTSHWVGGQLTDATGLSVFHWSTTGGDLRPAHFIGLHAAQIIPFAAISGDRRVVYGTALACAILTAAVFTMGILGIPLLRP